MVLLARLMGMPVQMQPGAMLVNVRVVAGHLGMRGRESFAEIAHRTGDVEDSEQDEHKPDRKFHSQAEASGDSQPEEDDGGTDYEDR